MTDISYSAIARKKRIIRFSFIIAILAVVGWIGLTGDEAAPQQPQHANTLSISGPWEMSSLEPSKQGYILTRMQVLETLLNVNAQGELIPGLATAWQVSEDGLSWLFTLREDVFFHDGTKMDAKAVLRSLGFARQKHGALNKAAITQIDMVDDHQIRIQLEQPYVSLGALVSNYSTAILSPASFQPNGDVKTLYGSGPYQIEQFSPPHRLIVKKFDGYWGQPATIPYASYLTGHRAESRLLQAKSGEADIVFTLDPAMLSQLSGHSSVTVHSDVIPRTLFLKLNNAHPFLADVKARQALNLALDRPAIAENVLHSPGTETAQLLPGSMSQWHIEGLSAHHGNLDQANELLRELGWQRDETGQLYRDGQPFALTLITYADRPELTTVATAIQAQWAKLGVKLAVDITNSSQIPAGHHDGSLEVALIARNFGVIADPLPILSTDFAHGGGDWGTMNWHNTDVDQALAELQRSTDPARNYQLSQKVAQTIVQEQPVLPLASYSQHTAVNERVRNFRFDPYERNYFINQMELK